ncbi:hypothetical protein ACLX1H_000250 [Fusarium chlamydosporum]
MSVGSNMSNKSEASLIEMIEMAVRRLHSRKSVSSVEKESDKQELQSSYDRFKEWTALCVGASGFATDSPPVSNASATNDVPGDVTFADMASEWQNAGDTMSDLMNWTKQMESDMETAVSGDIFSDSQVDLTGTATSEISWEDAGWNGD